MKRIESLLRIAGMKFEFLKLEIRFRKRQVSFLVVKTVKCKRGISYRLKVFNTPIVIFVLFRTHFDIMYCKSFVFFTTFCLV